MHQKVFKSLGSWYKFYKILMFTWKLILSLATNTIRSVLWLDRFTLFKCEKLSARYPNLNNHSLSVILLCRKWCSIKQWLVQLATRSHNSSTILGCSRSVLYLFPISPCRILRRCILKGKNLTHLIIFTASLRVFSEERDFFLMTWPNVDLPRAS